MRLRLLFCLLLLQTAAGVKAQPADEGATTPAFVSVPELSSGFRQLYVQKFPEGRAQFEAWETEHPDEPFGQVAIAASHLFEEFYRQGVLTSDFFLNEKDSFTASTARRTRCAWRALKPPFKKPAN